MNRQLFAWLLIFVFLFGSAACGTQAATPQKPTEAVSATEPLTASASDSTPIPDLPVLFQIVRPDASVFDMTLAAVKGLKLTSLTVEGKVQEGPSLKDVLGLAGITEFSEVTLNGSSASVTLTFDQVDANTILDFSNRGTMKLATTYVPKAEWTKDITEIVVK